MTESGTVPADYLAVTELAGDEVSREQIERLCRRYYWAGGYCVGRDVAEVACGTGQGLGYLAALTKSLRGGDCSAEILAIARQHYENRVRLEHFDAQRLPYGERSLDVVVIFEAIYYLRSFERFLGECRRVLRLGGRLLIATANKDLFDFSPSPLSVRYYGVVELGETLARHGFSTEFFGDTSVDAVSWKQRVLRPVKKLLVASGFMPKSMAGKKLLKQLVFGGLVRMPAEITAGMVPYQPPTRLIAGEPDRRHKVILCAATRMEDGTASGQL
jgi:SAM-dependent methyltransferase